MLAPPSAARALSQQHVPRGKMSRLSVGNLINHTTQSTGGPVGVRPAQASALPRAPPLDIHKYSENGREYYAVNNGVAYPFPCDEDEDESLDYFHVLIHDVAFNKRLHQTDFRKQDRRALVVDVGHGTGIWTYEQAEWTPWADVVGIDLHSRTPERIDEMGPVVNASFITPVNFLHSDWPFTPGSVDLIRMSRLCGSVPSWLEQYQTLTRYLRPGDGYVEHIEFDWTPRPMDGNSFPHQANDLLQWWYNLQSASRIFGKPLDCPTDIDQVMQRCGLVDFAHRTVRVPLRYRRDDEREEKLCEGFRHATARPFEGRIPRTFESLSMSLFTRQLGWQAQAVSDLCARLRAIVLIEDLPIYFNLHVWTARKPRN